MNTQNNPIGRVVIVTGANKGIGKEVARQLAQAGLTVLLGSRDERRGTAAAEELAEPTNGRRRRRRPAPGPVGYTRRTGPTMRAITSRG
jgi:NAD(P)-dependent dehydrogenase (short-subunit alcohol dehydrogenase family)